MIIGSLQVVRDPSILEESVPVLLSCLAGTKTIMSNNLAPVRSSEIEFPSPTFPVELDSTLNVSADFDAEAPSSLLSLVSSSSMSQDPLFDPLHIWDDSLSYGIMDRSDDNLTHQDIAISFTGLQSTNCNPRLLEFFLWDPGDELTEPATQSTPFFHTLLGRPELPHSSSIPQGSLPRNVSNMTTESLTSPWTPNVISFGWPSLQRNEIDNFIPYQPGDELATMSIAERKQIQVESEFRYSMEPLGEFSSVDGSPGHDGFYASLMSPNQLPPAEPLKLSWLDTSIPEMIRAIGSSEIVQAVGISHHEYSTTQHLPTTTPVPYNVPAHAAVTSSRKALHTKITGYVFPSASVKFARTRSSQVKKGGNNKYGCRGGGPRCERCRKHHSKVLLVRFSAHTLVHIPRR